MAREHRKGKYTPTHPNKYKGNADNIVYRSSWEHEYCRFLDHNVNVLEWSSEEVAIPYIKPTDGKVHRYFPDFWVKFRNRQGEIVQELIEIKPLDQINPPRTVGKRKKRQLMESITYAINRAKWEAAAKFCNKYGMKFKILSEKELFR